MYVPLRQLEKQITKWINPTCPAYSRDKIFLSEINQLVPRTVDWRKLGSAPPPVYQRREYDCYVASTLWNLQMFGKLINMNFKPTYGDLLKCDFRNVVDNLHLLGGQPKFLLEYCMRNRVFFPKGLPLSGYMRIFPLREDFLLRSIAQQPTLVGMQPNSSLRNISKGIYRLPPPGENVKHLVNAVGYDDDDIILQDTYNNDGKGPTLRVPRGTGHLFGENGLYRCGIFPVMEASYITTTDYNNFLIDSEMYVGHRDICYCPKDVDSVINDNNWPMGVREELRSLSKLKELRWLMKMLP